MPVGTIYTYFKKKDDILTAILDEGWTDLAFSLERIAGLKKSGIERLTIIVEEFLPVILEDLALINILLTEAIELTRIEEKMDRITDIIFSIIRQ